jgi:hypothetical protein
MVLGILKEFNEKRLFLIGFLSTIALSLPYFSQEFIRVFTIHPRIVSVFLIVCIILISRRVKKRRIYRKKRIIVDALVFFLLFSMVLYYYPDEGYLEFKQSYNLSEEYASYKMGRVLVNFVPIIFMARICSTMIQSQYVKKGMVFGMLLVGILSLAIVFFKKSAFSSVVYSTYLDGINFGTIGMSLNIVLLLIATAEYLKHNRSIVAKVLAIGLVVGSLVTILMLSQRTAMLIALFLSLLIIYRLLNRFNWMLLFVLIFVVIFLSSYNLTWLIEKYPTQIGRLTGLFSGSDNSVLGRVGAWSFCLNGFFNNPLGHGFGSFPVYYHGMLYPHNVLMEAMFELGFVGAIPVIGLLYISIKWAVSSILNNGFRLTLLIMIAGFLMAMKAGSFESLGPWIFGLYLVAGDTSSAKTNFQQLRLNRN